MRKQSISLMQDYDSIINEIREVYMQVYPNDWNEETTVKQLVNSINKQSFEATRVTPPVTLNLLGLEYDETTQKYNIHKNVKASLSFQSVIRVARELNISFY